MKMNSNPSILLTSIFDRILFSGVQSIGRNLIAFSGGVDSSVVTASVFHCFPKNSIAIIGISAALPKNQLILARNIANDIGIPLQEVITKESSSKVYIENQGMSCYACKTHLYSALQETYDAIIQQENSKSIDNKVIIFNGTNKDDIQDPTRVGLIAAKEYSVCSPIDHLTKDEVRQVAKELNLQNFNHAASPCLRSRLAMGVLATTENMTRIESAENIVRDYLKLDVMHNMRVRHLNDNAARIELDEEILHSRQDELALVSEHVANLGFKQVFIHPFKSGGIAVNMNNLLNSISK